MRKIEAMLEEKIRPSLRAHGGDVTLVDYDNNRVFVILVGGCQGCSSSGATLKDGIARVLKQHFPEIEEVVDLTDHSAGKNPYYSDE